MTDKDSSIAGSSRRNRALRKIRSSDIPEEIKATLQALIDFLDPRSNYCIAWPSVATLAKRLQKSSRTIKYHLKAIRAAGIFDCVTRLLPEQAVAYVEKEFGYRINLSKIRGHAPTLYRVNLEHPLWGESRRLPYEVIDKLNAVIAEMRQGRDRKVSRGAVRGTVDGILRGAVDGTQLFYKKEGPIAPPFSSKASTNPLFDFHQKGVGEATPDFTCEVKTPELNSHCFASSIEFHHLPTQPPHPLEQQARPAESNRRVVPVPVRRPAISGLVVPTAATVHAVDALKVRSPTMVVTPNSEISNS